ncbi:peroxidase 44-like [Cicer arietinum]|uniref:Peroxidase n=1 Tax=Cicer arietinum TaxID=3827 RepID=A0A1S2XRD6_CICAR|nr:peroxidase 44-like [Cicer arietinum]
MVIHINIAHKATREPQLKMKFTISFLLFFLVLTPFAFSDLNVGFYNSSCPKVEYIVSQVVQTNFNINNSITVTFLRMHFHVCFARGCDASILIDSMTGKESENDATPNESVRGYEMIDEIKNFIEKVCPSMVSCADIISLPTRYFIVLAGGPNYKVPTGRRDGIIISTLEETNIPSPRSSISDALKSFNSKGMTMEEMVTLLGAHTVGFTYCNLVRKRLSNDSSMEPSFGNKLVGLCSMQGDPKVFLDQNTSLVFDNQLYNQFFLERGVLAFEQQFASDSVTKEVVMRFTRNGESFMERFVDAMVEMENIGVLLGNEGYIGKNCRVFNS